MATTPEATTIRRSLQAPQVAVVAGVVVVVGVALWLLLVRGGGEPEAARPQAAPSPDAVAEPADPDPEPDGARGRRREEPGSFATFSARDPFEPLISTSSGAGTTSGTTDTSASGGTTDTSATAGSGDTVGAGTGGGTSGGAAGTDVGGHRVTVIDVYERNGRRVAQVEVDGTVYTVQPGETFADGFRLVSASGQCATMSFEGDRFTACEGEELLK